MLDESAPHFLATARRMQRTLKRGLRAGADQAARMSGLLERRESALARDLTVLMYHRVLPAAQCSSYPFPSLVMRADAFREQVRWLAEHGDVLPLAEALARVRAGSGRPVYALTFDDGYHDSGEIIADVLDEAGVRGTFFVTAGFVGTTQLLWFDRAALLFDAVSDYLRRGIVQQVCGECRPDQLPQPRMGGAAWARHLKSVRPEQRAAILSSLELATGGVRTPEGHRALSVAQVVDLHRRGHEIGSHTVSHAMLPQLDDTTLRQELEQSRDTISNWIDAEVPGFCYPDGQHDDRTVAAVARAGHAYACTTLAGVHHVEDDPFRIRRVDIAPQRVLNIAGRFDLTAFRRELCGLYRQRPVAPLPMERRLRVAYLTNQYPKTSHTFIRREIAGLEAAGVDVERISVRSVNEPLVDPADRRELARTRVLLANGALGLLPGVLVVSATRPLRTLMALRTALRMGRGSPRGVLRHLAYLAEACVLLRWVSRLGIERIHAHFSTNPTDVALLCRELGGPPFSFTAHGTADLGSASAASLPIKLERADFAAAVCEDGRRQLLRWTPGGHEHKIHVVHCGVDGELLLAPEAAAPSAPRLVCVARLSPEKGLDVLLQAAALLASEGLDFELSILGDGSQREQLEALVAELHLTRHVRFEGWRSGAEVQAHIRAARALVVASTSEGLPVVIMESLALHRPVIATRVGGISELVVPGECGWLVAAGSAPELAAAMRAALTLPVQALAAMGRRGALRVAVAHDASAEARKMARLLSAPQQQRVPTRLVLTT